MRVQWGKARRAAWRRREGDWTAGGAGGESLARVALLLATAQPCSLDSDCRQLFCAPLIFRPSLFACHAIRSYSHKGFPRFTKSKSARIFFRHTPPASLPKHHHHPCRPSTRHHCPPSPANQPVISHPVARLRREHYRRRLVLFCLGFILFGRERGNSINQSPWNPIHIESIHSPQKKQPTRQASPSSDYETTVGDYI